MTRRYFLLALSLAAALFGAYLFYGVLQRYEFDELAQSLQAMSPRYLLLALTLSAGSFICIAAMEALAVRYAERGLTAREPEQDRSPISWARIWRTAVAAIGVGHSLGVAALSSGAIRYRMYGRRGLGLTAISEIVVFSGISVALGLGFVGGLSLLWHGERLGRALDISSLGIHVIGASGLALCALYVALCAAAPPPLRIARYRLRLPSWRVALLQIFFSSLNYGCVSAVLYATLASFARTPWFDVAALFVGSEFSALVGHVPGGWGVLEYVFTSTYSGAGVVTGLLLFRAIYYLLPMFVGFGVWLIDEIAGRRAHRQEPHQLKAQNA
ncbi:MAG TPA: YbhN family protein [Alphaproteobacteria bacterium]|nr:YbhN family protein [Alphaproteobacteria bacterium]